MKHVYFFLLLFFMISTGEQGIIYELEWINNELKVANGKSITYHSYITLYYTTSKKKAYILKTHDGGYHFTSQYYFSEELELEKRKQVVDQLVKFIEIWRRPPSYSASLYMQHSIVRVTYEIDHGKDRTLSEWRLFKFIENEKDLFFLQVPLNSLNSVHIADVFILVNDKNVYVLTTCKNLKRKYISTKKYMAALYFSSIFKSVHNIENKEIINDIKSWPVIDSNISPTIRSGNDIFADEVKILHTKMELIWYSNKKYKFHKQYITVLNLRIGMLLEKECAIIYNDNYKEAFIYIKNQANIETIRNILKKGEELATNKIKVFPISIIAMYPSFFGFFKELVQIMNENSYQEMFQKVFSVLNTSYFL